jgi:hypothetical protein
MKERTLPAEGDPEQVRTLLGEVGNLRHGRGNVVSSRSIGRDSELETLHAMKNQGSVSLTHLVGRAR